MNQLQIVSTKQDFFSIEKWNALVSELPELTLIEPLPLKDPYNPSQYILPKNVGANAYLEKNGNRVGVLSWNPNYFLTLGVWIDSENLDVIGTMRVVNDYLCGTLRYPTNKPLYNAFTTTFSMYEAVETLKEHPLYEIDLTSSHYFYNFSGDGKSIRTSYEVYYEDTLKTLSEELGMPIARCDSTLAYSKSRWTYLFDEFVFVEKLAVWEHQGCILYVRSGCEDESPILISMGVEGSKEIGYDYCEPFRLFYS